MIFSQWKSTNMFYDKSYVYVCVLCPSLFSPAQLRSWTSHSSPSILEPVENWLVACLLAQIRCLNEWICGSWAGWKQQQYIYKNQWVDFLDWFYRLLVSHSCIQHKIKDRPRSLRTHTIHLKRLILDIQIFKKNGFKLQTNDFHSQSCWVLQNAMTSLLHSF